ncbi:OstA-like protein [Alistipes sp. AF48-12]|uniref:OstA-like protein n=1 Tax=Alistipes sp. AF48-12 TaxID=2291998 RepID=UPI0011C35737|nr:OstA-like protein [Alistipes sp. AF48-12]
MIRRSRIAAVFAVLLLACIAGVRGQEVTTVDFRADVMSSIKIADSTALCLVGHVVFFHNGAVITCDSAIRYSDRMMDCYRNVVVNKDSTFIYGDKADYNGLLNEARIYSPLIKMVDKDATLYTYNFTFNTLTNIGRYYGGGTMSQKDNLMESDEGYYYADNRELIGVRNVEMQNPQYTISSDSVTYNMDTEIATFDTPSYIWNDQDEFLTARRGSYNAKEDLYTFTDSSYIMTKTQELWADTIVYRQTGQDAVLRNNIQIADQEQKAMAFGDYGQYWGDKKQALLTRDPSVLSYEEGEQPDTVFMRSDSIFIYTLNRFRNDSVPTQKTADSLAAETPAPSPAADSAAVRPATNGPGRPPIPTLPDGQAPPPASAPLRPRFRPETTRKPRPTPRNGTSRAKRPTPWRNRSPPYRTPYRRAIPSERRKNGR